MKDYTVSNSKIEGKGLFASKDFKKGDILYLTGDSPSESKIYSDEEFDEFVKWCKKNGKQWDSVSLGNGKHRAAIADRENHPENYVNHSCTPNLDKKHVALRDINAGEELTIDYTQFSSKDWSMECNCGAKSCKKVIRGDVR